MDTKQPEHFSFTGNTMLRVSVCKGTLQEKKIRSHPSGRQGDARAGAGGALRGTERSSPGGGQGYTGTRGYQSPADLCLDKVDILLYINFNPPPKLLMICMLKYLETCVLMLF